MQASTPSKALLRYLYCREDAGREAKAPLASVLSELRDLDSKTDNLYGLSLLAGIQSQRVEVSLQFLHQMGLVDFRPANPHVELTDFGRAVASRLTFSQGLERAVQQFLDGSGNLA
jgi:hypothetical protein